MGFMADKGRSILRNGYNPIPVKPGQKAPSIDDWRREITEADVENWVSNGRANHNVGITTGAIVLIDSDIQNQGMSKRIKDWIELHLGFAPVRVGNYPKFGMMFRTEKPFRKISSQPWLDPEGRKVQIEILGEGQQFVAFGRHPDTGKDYYWSSIGIVRKKAGNG